MSGYGDDLAHIHDDGFSGLAQLAATRVLGLLRDRGADSGLIVELGCGGGIAARRFLDAGYDVLGIDRSPAMVALARARAPEGRFEAGSFAAGDPLPACRAVVAIGEVLNYRLDPDAGERALPAVLRRVRAALAPGGLFVFDLAGPGRVAGGGPVRSWTAGREWAVLVEAEEDRAARLLTRRMTTFRRPAGASGYRRGGETHVQRLYGHAEAAGAARDAGFRVRTLRGYGPGRFAPGHRVFVCSPR